MSDLVVGPAPGEDWEDLMRQLRRQPKARPRPFFYHRVHAKLAAGAASESPALPGWLHRPAYAVLLGTLVLVLSGDCAALRIAAGTPRGEALPKGQLPRLLPR